MSANGVKMRGEPLPPSKSSLFAKQRNYREDFFTPKKTFEMNF